MAINYQVNGNIIPTVPQCQWIPVQNEADYQDILGYSNWYTHVWVIDRMNANDFKFLDGLRGSALINLVSSDQSTLNTEKSYTTARMVDITVGAHIGLTMDRVRVEFLVKVS